MTSLSDVCTHFGTYGNKSSGIQECVSIELVKTKLWLLNSAQNILVLIRVK